MTEAPLQQCRQCGGLLATAAGRACGVCAWCILKAKERETMATIPAPGYRGDDDGDRDG